VLRDGVSGAARAVLLAGATALAFFSGGYFDLPRAWAGLVAWALVAVAVALEPRAPARRRGSWLALGGLILLGGWTLASIAWAPIAGSAYHAGQLVFLYAGALLAACLLLRGRVQAWVEPALAAGAAIVIGYGLAGRLLPGILHFARSVSAGGRLEQPLTYWNAMGELAAIGFVLCARMVGDDTRARRLRVAAGAAAVPLGLGLYLSFSRGALFACVAGLLALVVAAPTRGQLKAIALVVVAGGLAAAAAAPLRGVTSLAGSLHTREGDGAIVLAAIVVVTLAAVAGTICLTARPGVDEQLQLPRRAPWLALALICAGLAMAIVVGAKESSDRPLSVGASRLVTFQSDRYAYWRVAFRAFGHEPIHGVGAGGWAVWWLRYRPFNEYAQDAHSLPVQTLAELGLVGLALLAVLLAGVAVSAGAAYRVAPTGAAGPIAALVVYAAHAPLDWDWQMPAVTLVAIILAGQMLALAEHREEPVSRRLPARDEVGAAAGP
jgi:hypothetical protein